MSTITGHSHYLGILEMTSLKGKENSYDDIERVWIEFRFSLVA